MTKKRTRKTFSIEFKKELLRKIDVLGESPKKVAEENGVYYTNLILWRKQLSMLEKKKNKEANEIMAKSQNIQLFLDCMAKEVSIVSRVSERMDLEKSNKFVKVNKRYWIAQIGKSTLTKSGVWVKPDGRILQKKHEQMFGYYSTEKLIEAVKKVLGREPDCAQELRKLIGQSETK